MRNEENDSGELPGQDSFLDIVANIVGILILLVMVVGLRASQAPTVTGEESTSEEQIAVDEISEDEVRDAVKLAVDKQVELASKVRKAAAARGELQLRDAERVQLAAFVAKLEEEIEERREQMGEDERRDFDLRSKLGAAEHELENLTRQRVAALAYEPEVEEIESLPTPLAQAVSTEEVHLRLAGGHVKLIPLTKLLDLAQSNSRENVWRLDRQDSATLSIGPIDGFRLRYTLQKYTFGGPTGQATYIGSAGWRLLPETEVLGETVDRAVEPTSELMTGIARESTGKRPAITVWTYPDTFNEFRKLKAVLFEKGYSVAARPLPDGVPIGGSPGGTKSSVQ